MKKYIFSIALLAFANTIAVAQGFNTATGTHALFSNTTGDYNTADGYEALYSNTTGKYNTATGVQSLYSLTTGFFNVACSYGALFLDTSGSYNVAIGPYSLFNNSNGNNNIGLGLRALNTNITGSNNIAIGYSADVRSSNLNNAVAIGSNSQAFCSNCIVLGSINGINGGSANTKVGIGTTNPQSDGHIKQSDETYPLSSGGLRFERKTNSDHWNIGIDNMDALDFIYNGVPKTYLNSPSGAFTIVSDIRMKKDINPVDTVLSSIMQLQAKTYHYKDNNSDAPFSYGFIAQDVEKLFPDFVTTRGVDNMKGIIYQNFGVIAIKGIQEQQKIIEGQQKEIDLLKAQNKLILEEIEKMKKDKFLCL